jgi:hypothetical protein
VRSVRGSHRIPPRTVEGKGASLDWTGCSKSPSSKAAGESKLEAYPLGYVEDFDESRTKLAGFWGILLLNTRLALLPPHILHNLIDICRSDGVDLRHVAEFPMVRLDAVGGRPFEGFIPVMVRFVYLMY